MRTFLLALVAMLAACGGTIPLEPQDASVDVLAADSAPSADVLVVPDVQKPDTENFACEGYDIVQLSAQVGCLAPEGMYRTWLRVTASTCDFAEVGEYEIYDEELYEEQCGLWVETTKDNFVIDGHCCMTSVITSNTKLHSRLGTIERTVRCASGMTCSISESFGHTYIPPQE